MSVIVVDDDIVRPRRFKSMHGTGSYWNCDSDHVVHLDDYCPCDEDADYASTPYPAAHYEREES